jgi:hypothetical protein
MALTLNDGKNLRRVEWGVGSAAIVGTVAKVAGARTVTAVALGAGAGILAPFILPISIYYVLSVTKDIRNKFFR